MTFEEIELVNVLQEKKMIVSNRGRRQLREWSKV